ncbi:MAG: 5-oxoprolinase subunit PxpB [Rhodocyclaceae bacterium]|nr:5-oxoprolinase subunit PxpB [Rhodocyclaceae bacterium]
MSDGVRLLPCGDGALTVEFGRSIDEQVLARVEAFADALREAAQAGRPAGVHDIVQTFRSVTLRYDPLVLSFEELCSRVGEFLDAPPTGAPATDRRWRLPVCYGGAFGPDLADVAHATGRTPAQVCADHAATRYRVAMLGFLPGFAFMDGVSPYLRLPRRQDPRLRVPPGSVAIAGRLTAIYPWQSPGGWHLLGRCPLPLFDASRPAPALLAPGDRVRFAAIGVDQFEALSRRCAELGVDPREWADESAAEAP